MPHLTFLPYVKKKPAFTLSGDGRLAMLEVKVIDKNNEEITAANHNIEIRGPGDILGMNKAMITRLEPAHNTNDFEPNYFPFLEFSEPDLLWRYTLDSLSLNKSRLDPWLSLVVISQTEINQMEAEGIPVISKIKGNRWALTVKKSLLPSSTMLWAAGHTQMTGVTASNNIHQIVTDNPDKVFCRLLCLRKLEPQTQYLAFLVPSLEASVQAAFSQPVTANPLDPAWDSTTGDELIKLPIYFRYRFSTSEFGDFESLARSLKPTAVDPDLIGTRAVDSNLMAIPTTRNPDLYFLREGALAAPFFERDREDFFCGSLGLPLTTPMKDLMNKSLQPTSTSVAADPLITFPVYGKYFRKISEIKIPASNAPFDTTPPWPSPWLHELNLDFRNRVMAAFGTRSIQNNKDKFLKAAWQQVGDLREANNEIRKSKAGMLIAREIRKKHLDTLTRERLVMVTRPFHAHYPLQECGHSESIKKSFDLSGIPLGATSAAFRRIAEAKIGIRKVNTFLPWTKQQDRNDVIKEPPAVQLPEMSKELLDLFTKLPKISGKVRLPEGEVIPVSPIDINRDVRPKFNMDVAIRKRLTSVIKFNDDRVLSEDLDPLVASVEIDDPMYKPLVDQSKDYFLPGLESLVDNGITMLQENRRAIEAYMVACNFEMMRTAIFHSMYLDRKATIFRYFWEPASVTSPVPDVAWIHKWDKKLGFNEATGSLLNLVVTIKGDLIRRYPETIVYAHKITSGSGSTPRYWSQRYPDTNPSLDGAHTVHPVFRARIGIDILCVGFPFDLEKVRGPNRDGEYYIVLQENSDLPRFGLDVATRAKRQSQIGGETTQSTGGETINDLNWSHVSLNDMNHIIAFTDDRFQHNDVLTSSSVALSTYQLPVRVAIHISELLPKES